MGIRGINRIMSTRKNQLDEFLNFYKTPLLKRHGTIGNARRALRAGLDDLNKNFVATYDAEKVYTGKLQEVIQRVVFGIEILPDPPEEVTPPNDTQV